MPINDIFKINDYKSKISTLELTINSLNQRIDTLQSELATERTNVIKVTNELSQKNKFISSHLPLFDTEKLSITDNFDYYQKLWSDTWGFSIHNQIYQIDRQYRAKHKCYSPLSLNSASGTGLFRGKHTDYCTSLTHCGCMDFQRRAMPCKHMYRLAYEFDVFMLDDVEYDENINTYPHVDTLARSLQSLSLTCKEILDDVCLYTISVAKRSSIKPLLALNLVVISNDKFALLDCYAKDELYRLLPENATVKKSLKKADLIHIILRDYPQVVTDLEKLTVPIELAPNLGHLTYEIRHYLNV